jgi:hypothetical protein
MGENRWSIWFDVEGFSELYQTDDMQAIIALRELMESLYRIGSTIFSQPPDRLFIHQFGDGFVVVSDFSETCPTRPIAMSLAVMRHMVFRGVVTKAAISAGGFADISSAYPCVVKHALKDHRFVELGRGLMTITPGMGTALINSYKLANNRKGCVLVFDPSPFGLVSEGVIIKYSSPPVIDWVHSNLVMVDEICDKSGLEKVDKTTAEERLKEYIKQHRAMLKDDWIRSTLESVGLIAEGD